MSNAVNLIKRWSRFGLPLTKTSIIPQAERIALANRMYLSSVHRAPYPVIRRNYSTPAPSGNSFTPQSNPSTKPSPKSEYTQEDYNRLILRSVSVIFISGALLFCYFQYEKQQAQQLSKANRNQSEGKPLVGGPFSLVDSEGVPVCDKDFLGKYMLIYFGYTFCPDVCPEELEKMAKIADLLDSSKIKSPVVPIFISVDPKRDSIASIKEYIQDFSSKFIGLTGTHKQIRKVARAYRMYYSAPPKAVDDDESDYLVDHSIFFFLMGPDGKYLAHFGRQETAESVVAKILEFDGAN